ncbi:MAG: hypothetical protein ABSG94_00105 [Brevinematales bacterium]
MGKIEKFPELNKLDRIAGKWVCSAGSDKTMEILKSACDGFCYLVDIESDTARGLLRGHGMVFFDDAIKKFRLEWYDNFANHITGEGNFTDDDTFIMIEKSNINGTPHIERHTEKLAPGGSKKTLTVENFINGEFEKISEECFDLLI